MVCNSGELKMTICEILFHSVTLLVTFHTDPVNKSYRNTTLSNSVEFEELVEKDIVVTERINTQIENHGIRGGDELYLKNKIKYKSTTQMAIVCAGSKPRNISINQSNLNSKNIPVYNTNYPQDVRAQYNLS